MRKSKSIFLSLFLLSLSSCANYKATSLNTLSKADYPALKMEADAGVVICAKTFNESDCKKYLDRDVIAHGYYPVQVYIENNSDNDYLFSINRVSLPLARTEEVAEKVHTSTVGRAAGYGAAALLTSGLFAIPAIVDGVKSVNANRALDTDFIAKAAKDHVIYQHSHSNMLMFIREESYQQTFTITLIDNKSYKSKVFKVTATR
jgi:hypothetical protein